MTGRGGHSQGGRYIKKADTKREESDVHSSVAPINQPDTATEEVSHAYHA